MIVHVGFTLILIISMFATAPQRSTYAGAPEDQPLQPFLSDLEFKRQLEETRDASKRVIELTEQWKRDYKARCIAAFGHEGFCHCLTENGPYLIAFEIYIKVVTHSMAELDFDNLSKRDQNIVTLARTARNQCVQEVQ
jgi:hypothetical protein